MQVRGTIDDWQALVISGCFWTSCCPTVARARPRRTEEMTSALPEGQRTMAIGYATSSSFGRRLRM